MYDYEIALAIKLFLENTQWRINKAKCETNILRNAFKIIYHYKILPYCTKSTTYE